MEETLHYCKRCDEERECGILSGCCEPYETLCSDCELELEGEEISDEAIKAYEEMVGYEI